MTRLFRFGFVFCLVVAAAWAARPFAQESSDLPPDAAARFGTLPNGIRYVIRANAEPKGRASLRFAVLAGSFMETERQRGLAHYLEHLSFDGSTHYAPGTLIEFFQRMGMDFGGDTNAFTSFDRTVYMIDLPDTKPATLAEGLQVFSDYAGGLLLAPPSVEKERPIILSEMRTRDTVQFRMWVATMGFSLGETRMPQRVPIGTKATIEQAQRQDFLDFYNAWYRPERMVVVAVGDFDPGAFEQQLIAALTPVAARAPALPEPDLGRATDFQGVRTFHYFDREAAWTTVSLSSITPYTKEPDNRANRLKYLPRELATMMLNRRLEILAKKEGAPFTMAGVSVSELYDLAREASVDVFCKAEQWSVALPVAEQELRRALEHGFQETELKEAVANLTQQLEQAVKTASTRRSPELAQAIVSSVVDEHVFTAPEAELALYQPALAHLTTAACTAALREAWAAPRRFVTVVGNAPIAGDAPAAIAQVYAQSCAVAVAAPPRVAEQPFAYTDFGPVGTVVATRRVEDLDATLITFANGVRLNLKKTDFEANKVHVSIRLGTGQLVESPAQAGVATLADKTFLAGGLGRHSADDLQRLLAGKTVGFSFAVDDDALTLGGSTNREDLLLQLQLLTAYIVDPGYRPEALRQAQKLFDIQYNHLAHNPQGPLVLEVRRLLASGDPRFGLPPREVLLQRTLDDARAWLAPQLATGALEVALVGDLDQDATIAAVARTLGALPKRSAKPELAAERVVRFPAEPLTRVFDVDTKIPKAVVALYWPTPDGRDIQRKRRLQMLSEVFNDRLRVRIREQMGDAYGAQAALDASEVYPGYGYIGAYTIVAPEKAEVVQQAIVAVAEDLQKNGVTEDELNRAKLPTLTSLRESARTNGYWLGAVLAQAQEKPAVLDWCRTRYADNEAIAKAELDALAKQYLVPARLCRVIARPAALPVPATPATAAPVAR